MSTTTIDYCDLAKRSINDPIIALLACCPNCGGDIGVHAGLARFLDSLYGTGVKFCEYNGKNCNLELDAREWVWTRHFELKRAGAQLPDVSFEFEPVFFEVAA